MSSLKTYIANSAWLLSEKALALGVAFFVSAYVARQLGPEDFGLVSYALALANLFAVAGHVGLSSLVVREIVHSAEDTGEILATGLLMKVVGFFVGFIGLVIFGWWPETRSDVESWSILIAAFALLFQPLQIIDFWFQAHLLNRYTVLSKQVAMIIASLVKVAIVYTGVSFLWVVGASVLQIALSTGLVLWLFVRRAEFAELRFAISPSRIKSYLKQGGLIFLGSIFAMIYLKIDQVMLRDMVGLEAVGVYAVAVSLSEAWFFIPVAIVTSIFPKLIALRKDNPAVFDQRVQQLLDGLLFLAALLAVSVTLVSSWVIHWLFGEAYKGSIVLLNIHIWASLFIFMRAVLSKWIIIEHLLIFSVVTQGLGALCNVLLNLWWIPNYGAIGAAYATLFSYAAASYLSLIFTPKTRVIFWMMTKAFLSPLRYPILLLRRE